MASEVDKIINQNKVVETPIVTLEDKLKNFKKTVDTKTSKVIRTWYFYLPQIVMTILSLFIIGAYQFVEANFDPNIFLTPDFWGNYLTYQSASWILTLNIISMMYKIYKKKHSKYIQHKEKKSFYVTVDEENQFIAKNAEKSDRARKIRAYKIWINQRIHEILEKYEINDLKDFLENGKDNILLKKEKAIKDKINYLLSVLTDEWIEENIDNVKTGRKTFTYAKVTRDKLVSGARAKNRNHGEADFEEHSVSVFVEYYLSGFIFISVIMFILLSFRLDPKENELGTYIMFAIKVFMIAFNVIMTWLKTEDTFELTKVKVAEETANEMGKYYVNEFTPQQRAEFELKYGHN